METTRFILLIALGLVLTMIWQAWQTDYVIPYQTPVNDQSTVNNAEIKTPDLPGIPNIPVKEESDASTMPVPEAGIKKMDQQGQTIHVKTDVLDVEISTYGGTIQKTLLLKYPVSKKDKDEPVELLKNNFNDFYVIQGGLLGDDEVANHKSVFKADKLDFDLNGNEKLSVPLVWDSGSGLKIIKTFTFYRGQYVADVSQEVVNKTNMDWKGRAYAQINRTQPHKQSSRFIHTYTGAVISSPEKRYKKIKFKDIEKEKLSVDIANGWAGMVQHYFFTALLPGSKEEKYHYYTLNPDNKSYVIGAVTPAKTIVSGTKDAFNQRVYFGPKLQKTLSHLAEGLELTVDYGFLWFIAEPIYWLLDHIHSFTNNWGWSIILVTLLLKMLFYKLSAVGYRSMANMRKVQPRLISIKERYKDDRARLNQAMMEIYKEEKINPLGGCFPIMIQIPVFISLYWVLLGTVELRQADFILWIHDLSIPDPYYVLPLLMGITMFAQQKLNPAPMDPVQAKVMSILPVAFTIFFAFFPSGLVLYWVVNNVLSIAQQWMITRNLEKADLKK